MTLIQGIIRTDHIWICCDNRISVAGKYRDDNHVKYVGIKCPDGTALLTYTGIAELPDRTKISDWIRTIIRGETRSIEATIQLISSCATQEISDYGSLALIFAVFTGKQPCLYQISNIKDKFSWDDPLKTFSITKSPPINQILYFHAGSGSHYIDAAQEKTLTNIVQNKPRNSKDFLELLISVNKRVALKAAQTVSSSCLAVEMPASGEPVNTVARDFENVSSKDIPFVAFGIDTTEFGHFLNGNITLEEMAKQSIIPRRVKKK